jgi:hypothetical protein
MGEKKKSKSEQATFMLGNGHGLQIYPTRKWKLQN